MEKPIVFLSHSSRDKAPLLALKEILDERAAGALEFFLSSDGESIKFGRNWVVRVSDALSKAKVMFVFLSPQSADSKWIHFEAGCAYAQDIRVVPVCLPGIDLNRITPPLSLLQGFNLHSYEALENLARICNQEFEMRIKETFERADFERILSRMGESSIGFFGNNTWALDSIYLSQAGTVPTDNFNPLLPLAEICKNNDAKFHYSDGNISPTTFNKNIFHAKLELPGCIGQLWIGAIPTQPTPARVLANQPDPNKDVKYEIKAQSNPFGIEFTLSPELFHRNAPLLDMWFEKNPPVTKIDVKVFFQKGVRMENKRHRLTTKLYQCGIHSLGLGQNDGFEIEGFKFKMNEYDQNANLSFELKGKLENPSFSTVINKLFESETFWQYQPDISEMFGNG